MATTMEALQNRETPEKKIGDDTASTRNISSQIEGSSVDSVQNEKLDPENDTSTDPSNDRTSPNWKRPISNLRWAFVVLGIAVAVFLYGIFLRFVSVTLCTLLNSFPRVGLNNSRRCSRTNRTVTWRNSETVMGRTWVSIGISRRYPIEWEM